MSHPHPVSPSGPVTLRAGSPRGAIPVPGQAAARIAAGGHRHPRARAPGSRVTVTRATTMSPHGPRRSAAIARPHQHTAQARALARLQAAAQPPGGTSPLPAPATAAAPARHPA